MNAVASVITSNGSGCADAVLTDTGCWTNGNVSHGVDSSCILMLAIPEHVASSFAAALSMTTTGDDNNAAALLQRVQIRITVYPAGTSSFPTSCLVFVAAPPSNASQGGLSSKEVVVQDWPLNRQQVVSGDAAAGGLSMSVPLASLFNVATLIGSPTRTPIVSPAQQQQQQQARAYPLVFLGLRFVGCTDLSGQHRIRKIRVELLGAEEFTNSVPHSAGRHLSQQSQQSQQSHYFTHRSQQQQQQDDTPFGRGTERALSLSPREASVGVTSNYGGATTPRSHLQNTLLQQQQQHATTSAMLSPFPEMPSNTNSGPGLPPPAARHNNHNNSSSNNNGFDPSRAGVVGASTASSMLPVTRTSYESNVLGRGPTAANTNSNNRNNHNHSSGLVGSIPTSPNTSVIEVEVDKYIVDTPPTLPIVEGQHQPHHQHHRPSMTGGMPAPPPLRMPPQQQSVHTSPERPRTGSSLPYAIPSPHQQQQQRHQQQQQYDGVSPVPAAPIYTNHRPLNSAALDVDLSPLVGAPGSDNAVSRVEASRSHIESLTNYSAQQRFDEQRQREEEQEQQRRREEEEAESMNNNNNNSNVSQLDQSLAKTQRERDGYNHASYERERHRSEQRHHIQSIIAQSPPHLYNNNSNANHNQHNSQYAASLSSAAAFYGPGPAAGGGGGVQQQHPSVSPQQQQQQQFFSQQTQRDEELNRMAFNSAQYYDAARSGRLNVAPSTRFGGGLPGPNRPPREDFVQFTNSNSSNVNNMNNITSSSEQQHHAAAASSSSPKLRAPPVAPPSPKQPVTVRSPPVHHQPRAAATAAPQQQHYRDPHHDDDQFDQQQQHHQDEQQEHHRNYEIEDQVRAERDSQHLTAFERAQAVLQQAEAARERSQSAPSHNQHQQHLQQQRPHNHISSSSSHFHQAPLFPPSSSLFSSTTWQRDDSAVAAAAAAGGRSTSVSDRIAPMTSGLQEITARLNNIVNSVVPSATQQQQQQQQTIRQRSSSAPPVLAGSSIERDGSNVTAAQHSSRHEQQQSATMNNSSTSHRVNNTSNMMPSFMQQHAAPVASGILPSSSAFALPPTKMNFVPVTGRRSSSSSPPMPDFIPAATTATSTAATAVPPFLRTMQRTTLPMSVSTLSSFHNLSSSSSQPLPLQQQHHQPQHNNQNATTVSHSSFLLSRATTLDRSHSLIEEARQLAASSLNQQQQRNNNSNNNGYDSEPRKMSPVAPVVPGTFSVVDATRNSRLAVAKGRQLPMAPRQEGNDAAETQQQQQQQPETARALGMRQVQEERLMSQQQENNKENSNSDSRGMTFMEQHFQRVNQINQQQQQQQQPRHVSFNNNISSAEIPRPVSPRKFPPPPPKVGVQPNKGKRVQTPPALQRLPSSSNNSSTVTNHNTHHQQQQQPSQSMMTMSSPDLDYQRQLQRQREIQRFHQQLQEAEQGSIAREQQQMQHGYRQHQQQVSVIDASPTTWRQQQQQQLANSSSSGNGVGHGGMKSPVRTLQSNNNNSNYHQLRPAEFILPDEVAQVAVPVWKHRIMKKETGEFMLLLSKLRANDNTPGVFVELQPRTEAELSPDARAALHQQQQQQQRDGGRESSVPRPSSTVLARGKVMIKTGSAALKDPALHQNCLRGDGSWALVVRERFDRTSLAASPRGRLREVFDGVVGGPLVFACELKSAMDFKRVVEFLCNTLSESPIVN